MNEKEDDFFDSDQDEFEFDDEDDGGNSMEVDDIDPETQMRNQYYQCKSNSVDGVSEELLAQFSAIYESASKLNIVD